ncbi:hypothetical protein LJC20_03755 [Eubacteriales bacterium OttesenSCG-928-M02]|nr:hypothetical protein [Eubacteriales bacterium OttesenSCG-928-M02]
MISSGYKKLAQERGLVVANGMAYGELDGYMVTLWDGAGLKAMDISLYLDTEEKRQQVEGFLADPVNKKEYRILDYRVNMDKVYIPFHDRVGTLKTIEKFINVFFPLLKEYGVKGAELCHICHEMLPPEEKGHYRIESTAVVAHDHCVEELTNNLAALDQEYKEQPTRLLSGAVGAIIGALVGAIPWAIVYTMGWIAGVLGFVIGWAALKGYQLLGGKIVRSSVIVLLIAIVIGVFAGQFLGDSIQVIREGFTIGQLPMVFEYMLFPSPTYMRAFWGNIAMGLLFAGLGTFGLLWNVFKEGKPNAAKVEKLV